ncbi:MAG: thioredoxin domain-containing protein [Cyanobacteria bacterium P01_E01_bin.45]
MSYQDKMPILRDCDRTRGTLSASLLIMGYGSYQCPQSGKAHQAIETLRQALGDRMCFIYRHFPQTSHYPQAQKAAESAESAGNQGKFWEMHDKLFNNQSLLDDAALVEYADQLGLDMQQFLQEMSTHAHAERIQSDVDSAREYGVKETPTLFVNLRHEGTANLEPFIQMILGLMNIASGPRLPDV